MILYNQNHSFYDIIVVGGGLVGSLLALKLVRNNFRVLLLEKNKFLLKKKHENPDLLVSAINYTSIKLLHNIQVWSHINKKFCKSYSRLEAWESPFSQLTFDAKLVNLTELGFIIENWRLHNAFWDILLKDERFTSYYPISIKKMFYFEKKWYLLLSNNYTVFSKLLVSADGVNSEIGQKLGLQINSYKYRQSCMIFSVKMKDNIYHDTAWQQFTPRGPRAFLPMYDNWASLVWYDNIKYIRYLKKLPYSILEKEVQRNFPKKLGKLKLYNTICVSLVYSHAHQYVKEGFVVIGDAAHTFHPMTGQGLNISFQDVHTLVKILSDAKNLNKSWNLLSVLNHYQNHRLHMNLLIQTGINLLYKIFNNNLLFIKIARNFGLICIQRLKILKKFILRYALGL